MDVTPNGLEERDGTSPVSRRRVGMLILASALLAALARTALVAFVGSTTATVMSVGLLAVAIAVILRRSQIAL